MSTISSICYLDDYTPSAYLIPFIDISFDLNVESTVVTATLTIIPNPEYEADLPSLKLDGKNLELLEVRVNQKTLSAQDYILDSESLTLPILRSSSLIKIVCKINPSKNKELEGLYATSSADGSAQLFTQCEAQGFRKICYFLDRPDILSRWKVTLRAVKKDFPIIVAGGDSQNTSDLDDLYHETVWYDPWPKPCYLFALTAGDFACLQSTYTTLSHRNIDLYLYCEPYHQERLAFAMACIKKSMRWEEEFYNLEYDLSRFNIVATDSFNMGAMENKGLNIFNAQCLLANSQITTDDDFRRIEAIIAHEYFHNWSGNRVTCRDWFQLTLKEGLTVFRDQEFSSTFYNGNVLRLEQVITLLNRQFSEDAGSLAHPIQPRSYCDINNFYTTTVYDKGAEVIRMIQTLLGSQVFNEGVKFYFKRHDGQAVTTEDFIKAIEDSSGYDLEKFRRWYSHYQTPHVDIKREFNSEEKSCKITLSQQPTLNSLGAALPLLIPLKLAIYSGKDKSEMQSTNKKIQPESLYLLEDWQQSFWVYNVDVPPILSCNRSFSAPIKLNCDHTLEEHLFLATYDDDLIARWTSCWMIQNHLFQQFKTSSSFDEMMWPKLVQSILRSADLDPHEKALLIRLPTPSQISEWHHDFDVKAAVLFYEHLMKQVAQSLRNELRQTYHHNHYERQNFQACSVEFKSEEAAQRHLKNAAIEYLIFLQNPEDYQLVFEQFSQADCMSDEWTSLRILCLFENPFKQRALEQFAKRWRQDSLVWPRWLQAQALSRAETTLQTCIEIFNSPLIDLTVPNQVRSLVATFCSNFALFHACDASGYQWVASCIERVDPLNGQLAAKLAKAFSIFNRLDPIRKKAVKETLEALQQKNLSFSTREVIETILSK